MGWECVGNHRDLKSNRLLARLKSNRGIAVFLINNKYYAMDHACYHHGGPMVDGDIEDIAGVTCISCPWHKYKISVESGDCLYMGLDVVTMQQSVKSKGVKQRVHPVKVTADGDIFVFEITGNLNEEEVRALGDPDVLAHFLHQNQNGKEVSSDNYASMAFNSGQDEKGGVRLHSAFVRS